MLGTIQKEILDKKSKNNIAVLAHSYQSCDILEIADLKGDSFALSVNAQELTQDTLVMCGVRFMAETLKIMMPHKKIILANPVATCPMAEQISVQKVINFKKENPDYCVMAYVNTTAELKAVSDVCVTSSSALKIAKNVEQKNILFIPDKNLGTYIKENVPEKNVVVWDGCCPIHDSVTVEDCITAKKLYPNTKILMHPELPPDVLKYADVIGSTAAIMDYANTHNEDFIIGTENSITDYLSLTNRKNRYYPLSKKLMCNDMRIVNIVDCYNAVEGIGGEEIILDEELRIKAKKSIDNMIALAK